MIKCLWDDLDPLSLVSFDFLQNNLHLRMVLLFLKALWRLFTLSSTSYLKLNTWASTCICMLKHISWYCLCFLSFLVSYNWKYNRFLIISMLVHSVADSWLISFTGSGWKYLCEIYAPGICTMWKLFCDCLNFILEMHSLVLLFRLSTRRCWLNS